MHAGFENPIHCLKCKMMGAFPQNTHLVEIEVGQKEVQFRGQQEPITLVRQATKVMISGSYFLWEPEGHR